MKRKVILITFNFFATFLFAQKHVVVTPVYGNTNLQLDSYYQLNNDSLQIELLKFYVSGIEFMNDDKSVWKEKNSFHLIDASVENSLTISLNAPDNIHFNKIKFNIGIDSITNVSGVMGGDLDPTKGMYWSWQSGYVNFKLEGRSNICKTRNNEFQFHLGGYQYPFSAIQTIVLNVKQEEPVNIELDLQKLISQFNLSKENRVMSPDAEAVRLSGYLSSAIRIKQK